MSNMLDNEAHLAVEVISPQKTYYGTATEVVRQMSNDCFVAVPKRVYKEDVQNRLSAFGIRISLTTDRSRNNAHFLMELQRAGLALVHQL